MSGPALVALDARAREAWDLPAALPVGAVVVGLGGAVVRVRPDGSCEELLPGHLPRGGAASDPANARTP